MQNGEFTKISSPFFFNPKLHWMVTLGHFLLLMSVEKLYNMESDQLEFKSQHYRDVALDK